MCRHEQEGAASRSPSGVSCTSCLHLQRKLSVGAKVLFFNSDQTSTFLGFVILFCHLTLFLNSPIIFASFSPSLFLFRSWSLFSVCACFCICSFSHLPSSFSSFLMFASLFPSQIFLTFSSYTPLFIILVIFLPLRLSMHLLHSSFIFSLSEPLSLSLSLLLLLLLLFGFQQ